ncbi:hypothetical protein TWF106_003005 [Orbilia oligospora]|uniref:Uncharacterized protein n=1 Tax=Orbilia oligospora TaxID=2813651 RepID=A0A6G1M1K6_ORBOL|nr:hypothetical protein TWF191_009334 [Orbilia oligospora]KAF3225127.1 hypothetical protein TWF106_003005 [Orbilia oligospora]KAF3240388.1 hypothetical protein TWF192_009482 [Orbilia oligospora]
MAPSKVSITRKSAKCKRATSLIPYDRDVGASNPCPGPFSGNGIITLDSVTSAKYEHFRLRKREYTMFDTLENKGDSKDLEFLVGKVITGWEPRLMTPKKFHSYCTLFSVEGESPLVFVPQGPIFCRDVVFDNSLYLNLPGNGRSDTPATRKIVDAKWKIGKFWFNDSDERFFHAVKLLGIKFEGMEGFGHLWSEFVDDGKVYCSNHITRTDILQIDQSEYEDWKLETEGYPHREEWSARRELPDGRHTQPSQLEP